MMFINKFVGLYSEFFVNTCRFCLSNYWHCRWSVRL
jgi:hypothetical protein